MSDPLKLAERAARTVDKMARGEARSRAVALVERAAAILESCDPASHSALLRMANNTGNRLVLSLGGGSVPGVAGNAALVQIVEELGVRPLVREVWGCSAGSIIAGCWASGLETGMILANLLALDRPRVLDPAWGAMVRALKAWLRGRAELPDGVLLGRVYRQALAKSLSETRIEKCTVPLRIIAVTDDGMARRVVFRKGPILEAIMASFCLPGIMWPVMDWNGQPYGYLDGGMAEKTPLQAILDDHRREAREQRLLVLGTHFSDIGRVARPRGFVARFISTISCFEERIWEHQLAAVRDAKDLRLVVLNPSLPWASMFDFGEFALNYLWCRDRFREQLSDAGIAMRFGAR